jgi:hypothetical protein
MTTQCCNARIAWEYWHPSDRDGGEVSDPPQNGRLLRLAGRMMNLVGQRIRPDPGGNGKQAPRGIDIAMERRSGRAVILHQQYEEPPLRTQPTMQASGVVGPQGGRQCAEAGLVVDHVECTIRVPGKQISLLNAPMDLQPLEMRPLAGDSARGGVHHRDVKSSFGKRQWFETAPASWDQNAARRQLARLAPGEERRIQAVSFPTCGAIAIAALPIDGLGFAYGTASGRVIQAGTWGTSVASPHVNVSRSASIRNTASPDWSRPERIVPTSALSR